MGVKTGWRWRVAGVALAVAVFLGLSASAQQGNPLNNPVDLNSVAQDICVDNAAGGCLQNEAASSTNPTLIPDKSDRTLGIGAVSNTLTFIIGGIRVMGVDNNTIIPGSVNMNAGVGNRPDIVWSANATATAPGYRWQNDTDTGIGRSDADQLSLIAGGTEGIRVTTTQIVALPVATDAIVFPATQVTSAGANTLDDYEEGIFTPTITFTAGSGTVTYTTQLGQYTKIGNTVFFQLDIETLSIASRTGVVKIGGLPFTNSANFSTATVGFAAGLAITAGQTLAAYVNVSATTIALLIWDSTIGTTTFQHTQWTDDGRILVSGHYKI
ncbi:hypothetical protein LCGC14_1840750 [marine sediment metagenome]|uniref:Uncharacterized protein n=1 Tax=marine sediment metagenome TaxID=412755 RepID=A0A0F9IST0_9ZZZZ